MIHPVASEPTLIDDDLAAIMAPTSVLVGDDDAIALATPAPRSTPFRMVNSLVLPSTAIEDLMIRCRDAIVTVTLTEFERSSSR